MIILFFRYAPKSLMNFMYIPDLIYSSQQAQKVGIIISIMYIHWNILCFVLHLL